MDFISIAKEVVNEYAEGLKHIKGVEYANRVLFVSLDEEFNATASTCPTILYDAFQSAIILVRKEVAITNSYWWFEIKFIDHTGVVYDSFNFNDWSIVTYCDGKFIDQRIGLKYKNRIIIKRDLITKMWIDNVKEIFDYFSILKNANTEEEQTWMIKFINSHSENEKINARNILLEKKLSFLEFQVKKYTDVLDRLELMIKNT